jgi:hypothetical protein
MATTNAITLNVSASVTSPAGVPVGHARVGVQFDMAAEAGKQLCNKISQLVGTSYEAIEIGEATFDNHTLLIITNTSATAGNYLYISATDGTTNHQSLPPGATTVLWPDAGFAEANFKLKFATAEAVAEITVSESAE